MTADVVDTLREIFRTKLNIEVSSTETDVIEGGLLDSLGLVELLFELERRFGITIALDDLDLDNFRTLGRIGDFVAGRAGLGVSAA